MVKKKELSSTRKIIEAQNFWNIQTNWSSINCKIGVKNQMQRLILIMNTLFWSWIRLFTFLKLYFEFLTLNSILTSFGSIWTPYNYDYIVPFCLFASSGNYKYWIILSRSSKALKSMLILSKFLLWRNNTVILWQTPKHIILSPYFNPEMKRSPTCFPMIMIRMVVRFCLYSLSQMQQKSSHFFRWYSLINNKKKYHSFNKLRRQGHVVVELVNKCNNKYD